MLRKYFAVQSLSSCCLASAYNSGSQQACRHTLGYHLQWPGVPRAITFLYIVVL